MCKLMKTADKIRIIIGVIVIITAIVLLTTGLGEDIILWIIWVLTGGGS